MAWGVVSQDGLEKLKLHKNMPVLISRSAYYASWCKRSRHIFLSLSPISQTGAKSATWHYQSI